MKRRAFKMKLKPGFEAEYARRHDELWPELAALLQKAGVGNYSIFLDSETLTLFAVQEVKEESALRGLAGTRVMKAWWDYMADIMEVNPDNSPVCTPLKEVFHLE